MTVYTRIYVAVELRLDGHVVPLPVLINRGNCTAVAETRHDGYAQDNAREESTRKEILQRFFPSFQRKAHS